MGTRSLKGTRGNKGRASGASLAGRRFATERRNRKASVTGRSLVYMPAVQELHAEVRAQLEHCTCLLIDGTCWEDDELIRLGIGSKTARAMGHLPIAGEHGSLEQLAALDIDHIIYVHINNTNPILIENSLQRQAVEARGIQVAFDGLEMEM